MTKKVSFLIYRVFPVHDGPGSRTTVFLSGCPLQCRWCANPEGWKVKQRLMYSRQKCRADQEGCRRCIDACSRKAIGKCDEGIAIDRALCESCEDFRCAQSCFQEALRLSGRWYHPEELMKILRARPQLLDWRRGHLFWRRTADAEKRLSWRC